MSCCCETGTGDRGPGTREQRKNSAPRTPATAWRFPIADIRDEGFGFARVPSAGSRVPVSSSRIPTDPR